MTTRPFSPLQSQGRWTALLLIAVLLPAVAAAQQGNASLVSSAASPSGESLTFTRDIVPIFQENCQVCHQPGAIAPMSLMTYDEVRPWTQVIKLKVATQEMPPYHYDTNIGIQELKHDKRLSREEIEAIVSWVDDGAPMGDPADLPPPVEWPDATEWRLAAELGEPDHVIASTPYDVPATGQDIWWQPRVESGITEERCIKAMEVKPSVAGRAVAHHANPYWWLRNEDGSLEERRGIAITEYALGKLGEVIPEDACRITPPNSQVSWDIHYYPSGEDLVNDVVELGIWFHPPDYKPKYQQSLRTYFLNGHVEMDRSIDLPPHGTVMTQGFHTFDTPVRIDSFQPHGHLRLKAMSMEIFYPEENRREVVSMVSNWNPRWHLSHLFEDDVAPLLPTGAVMILTGWYDNTAENPHNPDPDQWVNWGQRTTDEMSHGWIAVTHLDEAGYEALLAERESEQESDRLAEAGGR
ncbi:MAG: cytochrome c [Gemmatimonadota bacterium]